MSPTLFCDWPRWFLLSIYRSVEKSTKTDHSIITTSASIVFLNEENSLNYKQNVARNVPIEISKRHQALILFN